MTSWFRRNRWGLLTLPVAFLAAIGANAQRIQDYWWNEDLRNVAASTVLGEWVTWTDSFEDAAGPGARTFRVKVTGTEPVGAADDVELPTDLTAIRVTMDFEAAPDQVLFGCHVELRDDKGNRYFYRMGLGEVDQGVSPCVPSGHPGPLPSISAGEPATALPGEERPPQWTTQPVVVVPRSANITQVLLWWEEPDYLEVQLN